MARSYFVEMVAAGGTLLGGVKRTSSSLFASRQMAQRWMLAAVQANTEAGREIASVTINGSGSAPEIKE